MPRIPYRLPGGAGFPCKVRPGRQLDAVLVSRLATRRGVPIAGSPSCELDLRLSVKQRAARVLRAAWSIMRWQRVANPASTKHERSPVFDVRSLVTGLERLRGPETIRIEPPEDATGM